MGYAKNKMIEEHNKELAEHGDQLKFLDGWAKKQSVYVAIQDDVDIEPAADFEDFMRSNPTIYDLMNSYPENMRSEKKREMKELFLSLAKYSLKKTHEERKEILKELNAIEKTLKDLNLNVKWKAEQ